MKFDESKTVDSRETDGYIIASPGPECVIDDTGKTAASGTFAHFFLFVLFLKCYWLVFLIFKLVIVELLYVVVLLV